jgi:hypothetical protein
LRRGRGGEALVSGAGTQGSVFAALLHRAGWVLPLADEFKRSNKRLLLSVLPSEASSLSFRASAYILPGSRTPNP